MLLPVVVVAGRLGAQSSSSVTTKSGVYTAAQARRGEDTYMSICVACHPSGTYSTPAFKATWSGRSLADLYALISETMPKEAPGSLSPEEYAQVIAYILKVNGMPAGESDIPSDAGQLKPIRIEMTSGPKK